LTAEQSEQKWRQKLKKAQLMAQEAEALARIEELQWLWNKLELDRQH
jgi:hypothetical protein